jgi:hypothetical protein
MADLRHAALVQKDPQSMLDLADCLMLGLHDTPREPMQACTLYWQAAEAWLPEACLAAADICRRKIVQEIYPPQQYQVRPLSRIGGMLLSRYDSEMLPHE